MRRTEKSIDFLNVITYCKLNTVTRYLNLQKLMTIFNTPKAQPHFVYTCFG